MRFPYCPQSILLVNFRTGPWRSNAILHFTCRERRDPLLPTRYCTISAVAWRVTDGRKVCVISYANDSGAWFPYFYRHYVGIVGADSIFVVTPSPKAFDGFELGGLISCRNMPYDDRARARLISNIASGLQAYYEWTLVCDVDEMLIPYPCSGKTFVEMLDALPGAVSRARGFDVLQLANEDNFDLSVPIFQQRSAAIPNSAICKPHLARTPIIYSTGYHFCNRRVPFESSGLGFVTLHLKWACKEMRRSLAEIVNRTEYTDPEIERYSKRFLVDSAVHPGLAATEGRSIEHPSSAAVIQWESAYMESLGFYGQTGMWTGEHVLAKFLVSLSAWQ